MIFTIWVTNDCNLRCKYCYVNKNTAYMDMETAKKCIGFMEEKIKSAVHGTGETVIRFHGGEPLLNFKVIQYISEEMKKRLDGHVSFEMTTNGTVMNPEIMQFIKENVRLSVSIDGDKQYNDLQRVDKKGEGTYEKVNHTMEQLTKNRVPFMIRMTVNTANAEHLYDNYRHFYEQGYRHIGFSEDETDSSWNKTYLDALEKNISEIFTYLTNVNYKMAQYELHNLRQTKFAKRAACDGCETSYHINVDGKIYPCIITVGNHLYEMGTIFEGIDQIKVKEFQEENEKLTVGCDGCSFYHNCRSKSCKAVNYCFTGNSLMPPVIFCNLQHRYYKIFQNHKNILEGIEME